ncbi:MAG: class I SAM-dependent methyltransferase [Acidobacteria bacterium]|nr:class I SAM-dependent methyltransferase [Acidobacteriota bacterium]
MELLRLTPRRVARGAARRLGLHRTWIPGIRPFRLILQGKEFISCHACGGSDYTPFIREPDHQVVRCKTCRLYYVNPAPTAAELNQRAQDSLAYTEDQLLKRDFFRRRAEHLLNRVERILPAGRLLDVGCAIGTELAVGRGRGWTVTGIELSESSVRIARDAGLDVRSTPLPETGFRDHSFDLVTMNHVLEHVAHTPIFMRETRRILSNDGLLFISLPNVHAWQFYFRRGAYAWTFHHDHYIHFSVSTLRTFLKRYGFEIIEISTSRWLDFHDPIESRSRLFQAVNRAIEEHDLGIEIFCLARPDAMRSRATLARS